MDIFNDSAGCFLMGSGDFHGNFFNSHIKSRMILRIGGWHHKGMGNKADFAGFDQFRFTLQHLYSFEAAFSQLFLQLLDVFKFIFGESVSFPGFSSHVCT